MDAGYHIGPVSDYSQGKTYDKQILLRHDVDVSLDHALDMALLEKDNDIHATYYILLQSNLYNAMSPYGTEKIRQIGKAGHEIGLHLDSRYYSGAIEFTILSNIAQQSVTQWAQHMVNQTPPPPFGMSMDAQATRKQGYHYLSDSAMNWREKCWCHHINRYDKMQILIHPIWTMTSPTGNLDKWEVLNALEWEANRRNAISFREFRDLIYETPDLYTIP